MTDYLLLNGVFFRLSVILKFISVLSANSSSPLVFILSDLRILVWTLIATFLSDLNWLGLKLILPKVVINHRSLMLAKQIKTCRLDNSWYSSKRIKVTFVFVLMANVKCILFWSRLILHTSLLFKRPFGRCMSPCKFLSAFFQNPHTLFINIMKIAKYKYVSVKKAFNRDN